MRTERKVIMAAIKSKPECKASESTPKLPVRTTRKVLRDTRRTADPTLKRAAFFFFRPSSIWANASIARLDYLRLIAFPLLSRARASAGASSFQKWSVAHKAPRVGRSFRRGHGRRGQKREPLRFAAGAPHFQIAEQKGR